MEINGFTLLEDFIHTQVTNEPMVYDSASYYLEPTHFLTNFTVNQYEDVIQKIVYIGTIMNIELTLNPTNLFKIDARIGDDNTLRDIDFVFRILQTKSKDFLIVEIQRTDGCVMMFNNVFSKIRSAFKNEAINIHELEHANQIVQHDVVPLTSDEIATEWTYIKRYLETDPISGLKIIGGLGFQGVKIPKSIIDSVLSDYSSDIRTNQYVSQIMIAYASDPTSDFTELSIPVLKLFHETICQGNIKERYTCKMILKIAKNHSEVLLNRDGVPYVGLVDSLRKIRLGSTWPETSIIVEHALEALVKM